MRGDNTDVEWERFGATDPYFGVITQARFHRENLSDATRAEFFDSGREHVAHVFDAVRRYVDPDFSPRRVLDFGCGVGRLVIPFARLSVEVVGADVAESMLGEARHNVAEHGVGNVRLVRTSDGLRELDGTFDLVHSFIVFQHIPKKRGMAIFDRLVDLMAPGGTAALHVVYGFRGRSHGARQLVQRWLPGAGYLANLVRGRPLDTPVMQMNAYDLSAIFARLSARGIAVAHHELVDHGGALGVFLYFSKPKP